MGQEIQSNTQHAAGDVYQEGDEEVQANDQAFKLSPVWMRA